MLYVDWYTKAALTLIAGLLAWNTFYKGNPATVHAESTPYSAEVITANARVDKPYPQWGAAPFSSELTDGINTAAKGRELVTVVWLGPSGKFVAVFKRR